MNITAIAAITLFAAAGFAAAATVENRSVDKLVKDLAPLIHAIGEVETGGIPEDRRDDAIGDQGRALGRYQVHRACALDAGYRHEDAKDPVKARRIMVLYWLRYCPLAIDARDYEAMARTWNGGPRGVLKPATADYWRRVKSKL